MSETNAAKMVITVKLPEEVLAKIGAANASEFSSKLEAFIQSKADADTARQSAENQLNEAKGMSQEKLSALEARIEKLEQSGSDTKAIVEAVKREAIAGAQWEASRICAEVFAATGTAPIKSNPNEGQAEKNEVAEDDFKGQWDRMSGEARAEYGGKFDTFEAYKKAELNGKFKIYQRK